MKTFCLIICLLMLALSQHVASAQQPLAQQAFTIFEQHCFDCHGEFGSYTDALLIKRAHLIVDRAVIPKQPDASRLYLRLLGDADTGSQMPLDQEPLDADEIATIRRWIEAGAPDWEAIPKPERRFITIEAMLKSIHTHVTSLTALDRSFARYFTLTHLYNAGATDENLRAYRKALSKLVNSLSWGAEVIKPTPIDREQTIFYIDLRHYEWDIKSDKWYKIEQAYPYGLQLDSPMYTALCQETGCELPFVRADWFIASEMDSLAREDIARYRQALGAAGGVFGGSEPIQQLVEQFEAPLNATYAAAEVGLETADFLKEVRENRTLRKAGLLELMVKPVFNPENGESRYGTVKRETWESRFAEIVSALPGRIKPEALGITKPTYKNRVEPKYPDAAKKAAKEGTVILQMTIDGNGLPKDIIALTSLGFGLEEAAIEALEQMTFHPATKAGKPISLDDVQISYEFKLELTPSEGELQMGSNDSAASDAATPKISQEPEVIFQLVEPLQFADGTVVKSIAKDDIDALRDRPIRLGPNDHLDGVTLTNEKDEDIQVRTCREYDAALKRGYYANTNFDVQMSMWFMHQCGLLNALEEATVPRQSYISNPKVGITNLELIPFSVFPYASDEEIKSGATFQTKIKNGELKIVEKNQNTLATEETDTGQFLQEAVRADFNDDGIEDIFLFEYHYAVRGTFGSGGVIVLTRKSADGKFEVVRPSNPAQSSEHPYWFD